VVARRVVRSWGSRIFYTIGSQIAVKLPALRAGRPLPPGRFLVFISVTAWVDRQGDIAAGRIRPIEKIHLIVTQTRYLPACSTVPQPATLPRTHIYIHTRISTRYALFRFQKYDFVIRNICSYSCHVFAQRHDASGGLVACASDRILVRGLKTR
jgi:hypothetical protein